MPRTYVPTKRGKTMGYNRQNLEAAVQAANDGMSVRKAAIKFGIPKSTLADRVSGRYEVDVTHGRPTAVPRDVEDKIVQCVKLAAEKGIGISRKQLLLRASILSKRIKVNLQHWSYI